MGYMDDNTRPADSRSNATDMGVKNPNPGPNFIISPKVDAGALAGGTPPFGDVNSIRTELSYMDDNSRESDMLSNPCDSRAKNRNTIIELPSADATDAMVKNYVVDDFLCHGYLPDSETNNERPNQQGLYGKGRGM